MKTKSLFMALSLGVALILAGGFFVLIGRAAPANPEISPLPNSHTAPLTTTVSITYDEPISVTTVTSRTFAVHGMQSGLVTATHGVSGNSIIVTPTSPFQQGELVYVVATTRTLGLDGSEPVSATQWQFRGGEIRSRAQVTFTNINADLSGVYYGAVIWGDYDRDNDLDILLTGNSTSRVYRNDGGTFIDISAGLTNTTQGSAAWGDYDNDGDLDILLTGLGPSSTLLAAIYRNDAGSFTNIGAGLTGAYNTSAAWGDYDNDGDLDILLTGLHIPSSRTSRVYRNDNGNFIDLGAGLPGVDHGSVAWGDYDNDGDPDILLTGSTGSSRISRIYRNNSNGSFVDSGVGLPGVDYSSAAWGDYDNDGDLDILLTGYTGSNPVSVIYNNSGLGTFTDIGAGLTGVYLSAAAWGDYDNDGDLDVLLTGSNAAAAPVTLVYRNTGGVFTNIETGLTGAYGCSVDWGDYDGDGNLDILFTGRTASGPISRVYRNTDYFPDLVLIKSVTGSSLTPGQAIVAEPGDIITYSLSFSNTGALTATQVIITDTIPVSVTCTSVVSSGVTITDTGVNSAYVWQVADFRPGARGFITVSGRLSSTLLNGQVFTNTAIIAGTPVDYDPGDNHGAARVTISQQADLAITKTVVSSTAGPGDPVTYTLVFANAGPHTSTSVFISDVIPISVTNTGVASSGPAITDTGAIPSYVWQATDLAPGAKGTITITGILSQSLTNGSMFANTAVITANVVDAVNSNNRSSVSLSIHTWHITATVPTANAVGVPTTTVTAATFNDDLTASTATSATFVVHGMLSGLTTGAFDYNGSNRTLTLTPYRPFHAGEVVRVSATDNLLRVDGDRLSSYQWQFCTGRVSPRCFGGFMDVSAGLPGVDYGTSGWGDYDNDGDLDILLTGNGLARIYRNDGSSFTDINAGLADATDSSAAWGDYDNDGDLDILLAGLGCGSRIYRNDSGAFTDINAGLTGVSSGSADWGDYDNDGDLDILLTGYSSGSRVSEIYHNLGNGSFFDIGAGLSAVAYSSAAWGDYDNDGDLDILLTGWDGSALISRIYRNNRGSFTDIGAGLTGISFSSVDWGDYDNDGDLDILMAGLRTSGTGDYISRVYRNNGNGTFSDSGAVLTSVVGSSVAWGDYDNDGDLDILLAGNSWISTDPRPVSQVYRNDSGSFININAGLTGVGYSSVSWGDYDSDGDLDILLTGNSGSISSPAPVSQVYRNNDCSLECVSAFSGETPIGVNTNVSITVNSGDPGTVCALKRNVWPGLSQDVGEFQIVWVISATGSLYDLDLKLCYTAAELAGSGVFDENTITAYRWNEGTQAWEAANTTRYPTSNCVVATSVTQLSNWTIGGDNNIPTAVTLRNFVASDRGAVTPLGWLIIVGVVVLALFFVDWRKRVRR